MSTANCVWICLVVGCGGAARAPAALPSNSPAAPPAAPTARAAVGQVCDDGEHIYAVDAHPVGDAVIGDRESTTKLAGTVTAITRADGKRVDGTLDASSAVVDNCSGTGGGHAGCSMTGGSTIASVGALGTVTLFFGSAHHNSVFRGDAETECRNADDDDPTFASCSTASWSVIAGGNLDTPYLRVFAGRGGGTPEHPEQPLVQEAAQTANGHYTGPRASLELHDGGGLATVDGKSEPCLAVYRSPE
nr:hypothetical protein [Kofleriaceae bacterium]